MALKHVGPMFADAWRTAWRRVYQKPEQIEELDRALRDAMTAPVPLTRRVKAGDPDMDPLSPEFQNALDEELEARGMLPERAGGSALQADRVLAKAALRAARYLRLSERATAHALAPQLLAMADSEAMRPDDLTPEQRDSALGLIRIFRVLDAILPEQEAAIAWLHGANTQLGPLALLEDGQIDDVLAYLERVRTR